jgi:hypothetical protein
MATRLEIHWEAFTLTSPLRDDCVEGLGVFFGHRNDLEKTTIAKHTQNKGQ